MDITKESLNILIEYLNSKRNVNFALNEICDNKYIAEFTSDIEITSDDVVKVTIAFTQFFPISLPDFYIGNDIDFRAHVGSKGKLCLFDSSSLLIKKELPEQVIIDCFDKALEILKIQPGSKTYNEEVCREFDSYWRSAMDRKAYSCLELGDIKYGEYPMVIADGVSVIANTKGDAELILRNSFGVTVDEDSFERNCLIFRIRDGSDMIPLTKHFKWNSLRRYILHNTTSSVKRQFQKFLDKKVKYYVRYLLLIYPSKEGNIFFGFCVEFNSSRYNKIESSINCKIENTFIERIDNSYLTMRGGVTSMIEDKNVLLLGCGSVGGYIASNLCQSGILNLDILDNDFFQPENLHRHWLGFDSLSPKTFSYKADLVKEKLESQYPYVDIDSLNYVDRSAQSFISDANRFKNYDLIISALGEPTINLEINRILKESNIQVPFMVCFNEPYGIGGHVIAVNIEQSSCLQCLYTDSISSEVVQFKGSFVAANQNFKKNISGCSGSFVPYSCLDTQQTALLATKKAIDILDGRLVKNSLFSWIGSSDMFLKEQFKLSEWYLLNNEKSFVSFESFANTHCNICINE